MSQEEQREKTMLKDKLKGAVGIRGIQATLALFCFSLESLLETHLRDFSETFQKNI